MNRSTQALILGVLMALVGYLLFVAAASAGSLGATVPGVLLLAAGGLLAQVGVIGIGVRLGLGDHALNEAIADARAAADEG